MNWFRMHHGMPFDPKLQKVAHRAGQPAIVVVGVWAVILDNVSQADTRGTLDGFDAESVDISLGMDIGTTQAIVDAMQGVLLNGDVVPSWEKRQPKREREGDNSTDRSRKCRGKKKNQEIAASGVSDDATPCNAMQRQETPRGEERREDNNKCTYDQNGHEFDRFWQAYPKRVGKGRAQKAYIAALKKTDAQTLLAGVKRYADSVKSTDPQYIAHPATWLNAERWLDDEPPPKRKMHWNGAEWVPMALPGDPPEQRVKKRWTGSEMVEIREK